MTEDEARGWIAERWGQAAVERLTAFAEMVVTESNHQNLIAAATIPHLWARHLTDSAQLVPLAPAEGSWLDVGTGAGFPGMVVAVLRPQTTVLVEPRRRRAAFLAGVAERLRLPHVRVCQSKVEALHNVRAAVISARAVAMPEALLAACRGVSQRDTRYILPRGRDASDAVSLLQQRWRGVFHVEQSVTDPGSAIIVGDGVMPA